MQRKRIAGIQCFFGVRVDGLWFGSGFGRQDRMCALAIGSCAGASGFHMRQP